jgi:hypothetical protein
MFHTYVTSVLFGCCLCFCNGFLNVLGVFASVSDVCFKCFIYLRIYVANVLSGCFKVDQMLLLGPTYRNRCLDGGSRGGRKRSLCEVKRRG